MPSSAAMATRRRVLIKYVPALLLLVCATWFLLRMAASHVLLYSLGLTSRQKNQACDSAVRSLLLGFVHCATAVAGLIPHALGDACGSWLRKAHMVGDGRHTAERQDVVLFPRLLWDLLGEACVDEGRLLWMQVSNPRLPGGGNRNLPFYSSISSFSRRAVAAGGGAVRRTGRRRSVGSEFRLASRGAGSARRLEARPRLD